MLNQVITILFSGNHEYDTRSKDAANADQPNLLSALSKVESNLMQNITLGIPIANSFSENLTPVNIKLASNCRTLKRDGEIEKCYTIKGVVHIVKNNKLMKSYHLKDLQELFPEYVFGNTDDAE